MESDYVLPGQMILPPVRTPVGNLGLSIVSFFMCLQYLGKLYSVYVLVKQGMRRITVYCLSTL